MMDRSSSIYGLLTEEAFLKAFVCEVQERPLYRHDHYLLLLLLCLPSCCFIALLVEELR